MSASTPREDFRRWLKQRIDAGEKVSLAAPLQSPGAAAEVDAEATDAGTAGASGGAHAPRAKEARNKKQRAKRPDEAARAAAQVEPEPVQGAPADDSLEKIATEVRACTRCRLHETRTQAVPGVGPENAGLVFIGEGPGADEDARGEPFVGRAGQLLTKIIESVKLQRSDVFISNIVKCRPPGNRDPRPDEVAACEPFLKRQLRVLQPTTICALGRHAAITLLQKQDSMARFRTGEHFYEGVRVFPTYHPAALLRNPQWKRPVWEDIQNIRRHYDTSRKNP